MFIGLVLHCAFNTRSFPPVPAFGSIWVVLCLLFFRSAPSTFPLCIYGEVTFHGACFRESLVIRLHSEIGQIHLSTEAQSDHLFYQWMKEIKVSSLQNACFGTFKCKSLKHTFCIHFLYFAVRVIIPY